MAPPTIPPDAQAADTSASFGVPGAKREGTDFSPGARIEPGARSGVNTSHTASSDQLERRREAEEDRALVQRAQEGDKHAFRILVQKHQRRAFSVAIGLLRDENDAREIVQEAFIRVYRSLDKFEGSSSFFTWLYRIVTNLAIDHKRKPSRREHESLEGSQNEDDTPIQLVAPPDLEPGERIHRQQLGESIQHALDALPPYHRAVIVMREVEGLSYQEMADAMNVSKGTIMSRLFHARQKLQRALVDCYREQLGSEPLPNHDTNDE